MTLRLRTALTIAVVLVGLVVTLSVTVWALSLRNFSQLEAQAAHEDVARVLHAFGASLGAMRTTVVDYAQWNDTYAFAGGEHETYLDENLGLYFFNTFGADALALFNEEGALLHGERATDTQEVAALSGDTVALLKEMLFESAAREVQVGLVRLPEGHALVAASPILNNEGTVPSRGAFVMVRYLNEARAAALGEAALVSVAFTPFDASIQTDGLEQTLFTADKNTRERPVYSRTAGDTIVGFTALSDLSGEPALVLQVESPRVLYEQGLLSVRLLIVTMIVVSLTFSVLALGLVERLMLSRLAFLSRKVSFIAQSGNIAERITLIGRDELARLASDINGLLASLEETFGALRDSEERYALAARGANDGMWDWDTASRKLTLSGRCAEMLGLEEGEVSLEFWAGLAHSDDRERVHTQLIAHLKGETKQFETELRMAHRDGRYRWMLVRGVAVRSEDGRAVRMAGSLTDITQRGVFDALTGLPNRLLLTERLEHALCKSGETPAYTCAVLFMDLNRFKVINDSLGHKIGDLLLIEIAKRLQECVRSRDLVARIGGDEFVLLLEDISNVEPLLARIEAELGRAFELDGHTVYTGASIGVVASLEGYEDAEVVLENTDIAMYRAKELGQPHLHFDETIYEQATANQRTETELRAALQRGEFRLVYQPILSLETGALMSLEALIRWEHPVKGFVSPAEFIPVAEESGLIVNIGAWVLREACRELAAARLPSEVSVSVNLSSKQLVQPTLVEEVRTVLSKTGLSARQLKLEVTESAIIENHDLATAHLARLQALGVQTVMDDFGTGYSSLSYLHSLPIQLLKIDRSFVNQMQEDETNVEIIRAILSLAQSLNLEVVAEGIETEAQRAALQNLRCAYGQGYLFAKPLPLEEVLATDPLGPYIAPQKVA